RASAPLMQHVVPVNAGADAPPLLRIRGSNLMSEGPPSVTLGGEPVAVVKASPDELLLAPAPHQWSGEISVRPTPTHAASLAFDLSTFAPTANGATNGTGGHA